MKTAAPPKASDLRYALSRLCKETGAGEAAARQAYKNAGHNYNRAKAALLAEARREAERVAEWRYQQQLLELNYWTFIRPALRKWMDNPSVDPLVSDGDAFCLYREMVDRGIVAYQEKEGRLYVWRVATRTKHASWKSGTGKSDLSRESLVLAWWNAFQNDYTSKE